MPWCHHASPSTTQILFPCLQFDVHVQWFTLAVDSCDARCLLQPAINCLVWHWVSMILSAHWYMVRYIKHTRMHKLRCMQTHTHTRAQHTLIEPTWVVKLVACISGIDLFGIEPCHCCHLNFRPGTSPNRSPPPPSTTKNFPVPSLSEWKMDGTLDHRLFHSFMNMLLSPNQLRANFLWLPVKMSVERKSVLSHFCKYSPLISSSSPLWNISLLLKPKPPGAKSQWSLLLKLPSYQRKYHHDIASQIEW